jgi:hypothetical protein
MIRVTVSISYYYEIFRFRIVSLANEECHINGKISRIFLKYSVLIREFNLGLSLLDLTQSFITKAF